MSEYTTKRNEADELREQLSNCHDYIAKLEAECKDLKERLHESELAIEHNRHLADEGQLKGELRYRDGIIYGLEVCNQMQRCERGQGKSMTRLIDADAYEHAVQGNPYVSDSMKTYVRCSIQSQPTIDAVPKEKILLFLNIANEQLSKAHADKSVNGIMTWSASVTTLEGLLKEYDTADTDIVPVIRCRDCKYNPKTSYTGCPMAAVSGRTETDYCSRAERKETA